MKLKLPRPEKFAVGMKCAFVALSSATVPFVALVRLNVALAEKPSVNCRRLISTAVLVCVTACGAASQFR